MTASLEFGEYVYGSSDAGHLQGYLWKPVIKAIQQRPAINRILDLGCGNGAFARELTRLGFDVVGIDTSLSGISYAKTSSPEIRFEVGSAYDNLLAKFGQFDCVVSLEVVEHLYSPLVFAKNSFNVLRPGGKLIVSTPYHGYAKNLMLAVTGSLDDHFTALWEHGHIKFWSPKTLAKLLVQAGFSAPAFLYAGRFYPVWKSMIAISERPV